MEYFPENSVQGHLLAAIWKKYRQWINSIPEVGYYLLLEMMWPMETLFPKGTDEAGTTIMRADKFTLIPLARIHVEFHIPHINDIDLLSVH